MNYVPYYRVSTAGQGKSGLGLSAQREIVHRFLKAGDQLLTEFVEVESGKRADRPQLTAAIALAKQQGVLCWKRLTASLSNCNHARPHSRFAQSL